MWCMVGHRPIPLHHLVPVQEGWPTVVEDVGKAADSPHCSSLGGVGAGGVVLPWDVHVCSCREEGVSSCDGLYPLQEKLGEKGWEIEMQHGLVTGD